MSHAHCLVTFQLVLLAHMMRVLQRPVGSPCFYIFKVKHLTLLHYSIFVTGPLSFIVSILDFAPGNHTLLIVATDAGGTTDIEATSFTTPPRISVVCRVTDTALTCNANNNIAAQSCSFDGQSFVNCTSPFNISRAGLAVGEHNVTVSITDIYDQTTVESFVFSLAPTDPIRLSFPQTLFVTEINTKSLDFFIEGQATADIPFSLQLMTYQEFERRSGLTVANIFPDVPSPATLSELDVACPSTT